MSFFILKFKLNKQLVIYIKKFPLSIFFGEFEAHIPHIAKLMDERMELRDDDWMMIGWMILNKSKTSASLEQI